MEPVSEKKKMEISPEILGNLNVTRKWTMFLSVVGFIFLGLIIAAGLATSTFLTLFKAQESSFGIPVPVIITGFVVVAVIFFFSVLFLFRFSKNIREAVINNDIAKLNKAFKNLRTFFTYIGIILIIALTLYVIALIGVGSSISFLIGV